VRPGKLEIVETQEALAVAENLICDGIAYYSENGSSVSQNGNGVATPDTLNAFGRPVMNLGAESVSGAIAAGAGMGLTGLRAAVFVSGDQLSEGLNQVQVLPTKHIPLVLHASFREASGVESSHDGYYTAKDMGFFQVMPGSIQEAVDLTLLARWLAERALVPGFVASDRHAVERVVLPTIELVREFLGDSGEEIESPSAAQLLLFGAQRPTAPRWYDLDRPVSFSSLQGSSDGISAAVGREVFFSKHIAALAEQGMAKLGKLTGRPLSFVSEYAIGDAEQVIVTQGSSFQTVRAATELLRNEKGLKVGVLGVTWLRPFPAAQIQSALGSKKRVVVLECAGSALAGEPPLLREIRSCLSKNNTQWVSATYGLNGQPLHLGEVSQLIADSRAKDSRAKIWLGITSSKPKAGDFPKREGLLTAVNSDYPELTKATITAAEPLDYPGNETRSLQWVGPHTSSISETMERLAKTCSDVAGPEVHGYGWSPEPGVLSIRVSAGNSSAPIPEVGAYIDILLLGRQGLDLIYNPLADLRKGGSVVIESERTEEEIWALMPDFWRSEIRRLKLRLYKVEDGFEELNAAASALLSEAVELPFPELKWAEAADSERESNEVPALIRRVGEANTDYDNLPRFWGEVMQPKRGGISDNSPDPLVTLGAVPPYTAALARPRGTALPNIPKLDAEKCTGCGRCWPVCPDSAIGVSVIGLQEYLDSAAGLTAIDGKVAGAVRRAHRPIAGRVATMLAKQEARQITAEVLLDAYATVSEKMPIPDAERDEYSNVFQATVGIASQLNPVISTVFYDQPESAKKGTGKLLLLAINPDACQGCQLCITSCPETALTAVERAGERRASQEGWRVWEQMPDTAGETIAQASEKLDWGTLAARLLSRHCSQVQAVGSFGEPGSGERLAARLVTSFTESVTQRHMTELAAKSETLANSLNEEVKTLLAEGLSGAESGAIQAALEKLPRHRTNLSELSDRLSELGKSVSVDPVKTLRLIQIAQELTTDHWNITEGVHGLGRARFGVVILSNRIARWAGRFPNHPYLAPLIVDPSKDGAQLVFGLAKALTAKHLDKIRLQRKAQLWLDSPPDLPGQLYDIDHISWQDLSDEEKLACPPLLAFSDETALGRQGLAEFSSLLTSELPVKIVLLDSRNIHEQSVEPTLLAMSYQSAFVLSSSLAYPEQFASGLDQALAYAGPSLVHLHVPVPSEDGYPQAKTIERARLAVEARVHPILTFDPSADGVYGLRLSLDGNPSLMSDWGELNPLEWALGEKRFARDFSPIPDDADAVSFEEYIELDPAERIGKTVELENPANGEKIEASARLAREAARRLLIWKTAQEIAGQTSPFVERIRADIEKEIEAKQQEKVAAMQKDYEGQIAQLKGESDGKVVDQLRQRLLTLAGFGPASSESKEDANE
jgi:pyruvate-ferredoxin/flavodoxin oxidoreductase